VKRPASAAAASNACTRRRRLQAVQAVLGAGSLVPIAPSPKGWADTVFTFHDDDELGPTMLVRIAKKTGLTRDDL
jgi:hypothetical protein